MKKHISIGKIVKWGLGLALLASVLYIMFHHLGLIDSLDFGAGAYYYADIPGFEKYVDGSSYQSQTPMSVTTGATYSIASVSGASGQISPAAIRARKIPA